jgi:hypothetical protein
MIGKLYILFFSDWVGGKTQGAIGKRQRKPAICGAMIQP